MGQTNFFWPNCIFVEKRKDNRELLQASRHNLFQKYTQTTIKRCIKRYLSSLQNLQTDLNKVGYLHFKLISMPI
jgi:hypothetical protein